VWKKNERSWGSSMNIKNIFIFLSVFLVSVSGFAQQCESAKNEADTKCDAQELAAVKAAIDAEEAKFRASNGMNGSVKMTEAQMAQVQDAIVKTGEFKGKCVQAIQQCSEKCQAEKVQRENAQDQAGAVNAEQARTYCTQGKPKQVADKAEKDQGDMSKTLGALAQLLSALTGMMKPSENNAATTDECTVSATNTAAMVAANTNCSTDVATASAGTTFATGDYRAAKGNASSSNPLATGEVGIGTASQPTYAPAGSSGGGGGSSGGGGFGGRMGTASASGSGGGKGDKILPSSNFGGGGGGGGKSASGSGGGSGKPSSYGQITKSSIDDERQMQLAVDKAMQQRGPASDGPPGGISGAFSLDNFMKVEKRIQNERNQLNEL
jgi:hypothetical protein